MADIYVDAENGANGNAGTASNVPLASLGLAIKRATASDTIHVVGGNLPANIYRTRIDTEAACTIQPVTAGEYIHVLPCIDVSSGATRVASYGGDMEAWVSGSDNDEYGYYSENGTIAAAFNTVSLSGVVRRVADPRTGVYALQLDRTGGTGNAMFKFRVWKPLLEVLSFSVWYKYDATFTNLQIQIYDENGNYWNETGGTWDVGVVNNQYTATTSYQQVTLSPTSDPTGFAVGDVIEIAFKTSGTGKINLDDLEISVGASTYSWSVDTGDTYVTTNLAFEAAYTPRHMLKCSTSDWDTLGADALRHVPLAASLAACRATPSSCFYDTTTGGLYYTLASGETLSDLHLEFTTSNLSAVIAHAVTATGLVVHGGKTAFDIDAAAVLTDCHAYDTAVGTDTGDAFAVGTAGITATRCGYARTDGFTFTSTGSVLNRCGGISAWDDGFQSVSGGAYTANNCFVIDGGKENVAGNSGFNTEQATSAMTLNGCLAYKCGRNGIAAGTGYNPVSIVNCISISNTTLDINDAGGGTFTENNNAFETDNITPDATDITSNLGINTAELDAVAAMTNVALRAWINAPDNAIDGTSQLKGAGGYTALQRDIRGRRRSIPTTIGPWEFTGGDEANTRTARS